MPTLIITTKNGRHRKDHSFPITEEQATDPIKRGQTVSAKSNSLLQKMVNWRIED